MANVSIKFNGKEFLLSCEDGQEEHLEELLIQINQKFNSLKNDLGNLGENKLLLITAVKVMDEYYETKKKVDLKKEELKNLSSKLLENLYSLNQENTPEVGSLEDIESLSKLFELSSTSLLVELEDQIIGFIICFRENSIYGSENYKFFNSKKDKFI